MGICFVSFSASDEMIERVQQEPPLIRLLCEPNDPEGYLEEIGAGKKRGFWAKLLGAKEVPVPTPQPSFKYDNEARKEIDLDKSWDGINFCVKKLQVEDATNLFEDGKDVGYVDMGYGPARTFSAAQVKTICERYAVISEMEIEQAYAPLEMNDVYPSDLWSREDTETKQYLTENFVSLKEFLAYVSCNNLGIVVLFV